MSSFSTIWLNLAIGGIVLFILYHILNCFKPELQSNYKNNFHRIYVLVYNKIIDYLPGFLTVLLGCLFWTIVCFGCYRGCVFINKGKQLYNQRIVENIRFIEKHNLTHFYAISSIDNKENGRYTHIYYFASSLNIDQIKDKQYIKVTKNIYIKPFTITEISKDKFLEEFTYKMKDHYYDSNQNN